jgi:tRNA(fMet)-specific endonuclease VapC
VDAPHRAGGLEVRAILLDTNAYSEFKKGDAEATRLLDHAQEVAINVVVFGELLGGFEAGTRSTANRHELSEFLDTQSVRVLEIDSDTAALYAAIFRELRGKGTPIPQNDMWIAASALQHHLALFTFDQHFHNIGGLVVGHTLADFADPDAGESHS